MDGAKILLYTMLACFLAGLLVIALKRDYRVGDNLETNKDFYPAVPAG